MINIGEIVYIDKLGYAKLVGGENLQTIAYFHGQSQQKDDPYQIMQTIFEEKEQELEIKSDNVVLQLYPTNYRVYSQKKAIHSMIELKIKTLFDKRQLVKIRIQVNQTIEELKRKLFKRLEKNYENYYKIRLFYPLVELEQLQDSKFIWQCRLPQNAKLVLLAQHTFSFEIPKQLKMKMKAQTISKPGDHKYITVMGNVGWNLSGRYYWDFRIDKFQNQDDIFIGVAYKKIDTTSCPTHTKYWGILPIYAKKFSPFAVGNLIDYGNVAQVGDTIGVLVEFVKKKANITFFKNNVSLGIAYQGVAGMLFPALTLFGSNNNIVQVSYDPKAPIPVIN